MVKKLSTAKIPGTVIAKRPTKPFKMKLATKKDTVDSKSKRDHPEY